ncbi:hypothetical protein F66182_10821 [Fusarium sp. NRRL 66182]|nr:hypothetical protein F66182_10821 [Fusarium sp. NRRL 66182]
MMSCTCRATLFKIFVQGLTQVHNLEASSSLARLRTPMARSGLYENHFAFTRQARSLHVSKRLDQDVFGTVSKDVESKDNASSANASPTSKDETSSPSSTQPDPPAGTSRPSRLWQKQTKKEARPRWKTENYSELESGKTVRRKASTSVDSGAFKGVVDERPKGPPPGLPQVKENMWKAQKAALKEKFPQGWRPRKRLSPDALAGIRALNAQFPEVYTTAALADKFKVSPEAIRRILRSKWAPTADEEQNRQERWFRRGKNVWEQKAALGIKPPQKWRQEGITRDPSYHAWRKDAVQRNRDAEERDDREIRGYYPPRSGRGRS